MLFSVWNDLPSSLYTCTSYAFLGSEFKSPFFREEAQICGGFLNY